jgi:modulator of FtsH protease HflC
MKKPVVIVVIVAVVLIVFFVLGPLYVIEEGQQAVVTRFGKVVNTTTEAGLKFKMPLVDNVVKYSKRILAWDGEAQRIPTQEKMFIWVDTTARWRISDPLKFYESVTTMEGAFGRLDEVIDSSVRTVIAENLLSEAVRNSNVINSINRENQIEQVQTEAGNLEDIASFTSVLASYPDIDKGRSALSKDMYEKASAITPQYGVIMEDIIIRQIRYSEDLTQSVFDRMIKQRNQIAEAYRSYGEGMKTEWSGRMTNEKQAILSRAYETAEEIKGEADAEATNIYADAYEGDEEFFYFWRSIESYRRTLPKFAKTLTTDMDYFKYLYSSSGN